MKMEPMARLSDIAYERLRDAIIDLDIAPGSPIDEDHVRERFGFGLTPIRDALKRLTHERLVVIYPRRGTFAAEINIADDQWISEIRAELEGLAAALAAQRSTPDERETLAVLATKMHGAHTAAEFQTLDVQFHRMLYHAAHNPLLEADLGQHLNLALRIWNFTVQNFARDSFTTDDFDRIVAAIESGDAELARQSAKRHIEYSRLIVRTRSAGFERLAVAG